MSAVRPELGPTLPELLAPRLRALPRAWRVVVAAAAVLVVLVALWALVLRGGGDGTRGIVVHRPIAFNFIYRAPLAKRAPLSGELARLGGHGQTFVVRELRLPAYRGDSSGFLPVFVAQLEGRLAAQLPDFLVRYEGRANVNRIQGYEVYYQYRTNGRLTYARRVLLLPTTTSRQGVELFITSPWSPAVARYDAVGNNGALKTSLRSFRFGTERP
jgi:hypothetical protein